MQGFFPLLFVTLFLSSSSLPRNLIKADWFREVATYNPVSYLIEGVRSLIITGWDGAGARARLRLRAGARASLTLGFAERRDEEPAGAHVRRFVFVARAVAWRSVHNTLVSPAILLPSIIFPLFFLAAFAGGLSRIADVPNFDYPPGYTAFQFVFVFLQSAAFGGVFTGFADRARLRLGLRAAAAAERAAAQRDHRRLRRRRARALAAHRHGRDGRRADRRDERRRRAAANWSGCSGSGSLMNLVAALWACGVAMFLRTEQAGALIQMPVFVLLFLAPVYVPLDAARPAGSTRSRA